MDGLVIRLNALPKLLLVKVEGTATARRVYWAGHRLGIVGQKKEKKLWGYKAADDNSAEGGFVSRGAAVYYYRDVGPRLDVVNARGVAPNPLFYGVGRPLARFARFALYGFYKGRLLAAYERAGAADYFHVER